MILFLSWIIILLIVSYILLGSFLKFEKPIKSSNIILEGWAAKGFFEDYSNFDYESLFIFDFATEKKSVSLKDIDRSFKLKKKKNTYCLPWNGTLVFEIPKKKT